MYLLIASLDLKGRGEKKESTSKRRRRKRRNERDRNEGRKMSIEREERRKSDVRCSAKCNESVKSVCVKREEEEKREKGKNTFLYNQYSILSILSLSQILSLSHPYT